MARDKVCRCKPSIMVHAGDSSDKPSLWEFNALQALMHEGLLAGG